MARVRSRCGRRAGFGTVLGLVLFLLLSLGVIGLGHAFFSSFVSDQAQTAHMGDLALELAGDAVTAAHWTLCAKANTPEGGLLYEGFRGPLAPFVASLRGADLPGLADEFRSRPGFELVSDAVDVELLWQARASVRHPTEYDRLGAVRLSAAVRYAPLGVVRRLRQTYDLKVSLTTTPRPFDAYTFFVGDPKALVNSFAVDDDANKSLQRAVGRPAEVRRAAEEQKRGYEKVLAELQRSQAPEAAQLEALVGDALAALDEMLAQWPPVVTLTPPGAGAAGGGDQVREFPRVPWAAASTAPRIELATLNLPAKGRSRMARLQELEARFQQAADACEALIQRVKSGAYGDLGRLPELQRAWCAAALALAQEYRAQLMEDYKPFQDLVTELTGPALERLQPALAALDPKDLLVRSCAVVAARDVLGLGDARPLPAKLAGLLDRRPLFSGMLYVHNPGQELVVERTFRGRAVLVVPGDVTVRRARVEQATRDTLTLACFGRLAVEGFAQCSLVTAGRLQMEDRVTVTGNLVALRLDFGGLAPERVLAGTLVRDPRLVSGPPEADGTHATVGADFEHVALGPEPVFVEVERR